MKLPQPDETEQVVIWITAIALLLVAMGTALIITYAD